MPVGRRDFCIIILRCKHIIKLLFTKISKFKKNGYSKGVIKATKATSTDKNSKLLNNRINRIKGYS